MGWVSLEPIPPRLSNAANGQRMKINIIPEQCRIIPEDEEEGTLSVLNQKRHCQLCKKFHSKEVSFAMSYTRIGSPRKICQQVIYHDIFQTLDINMVKSTHCTHKTDIKDDLCIQNTIRIPTLITPVDKTNLPATLHCNKLTIILPSYCIWLEFCWHCENGEMHEMAMFVTFYFLAYSLAICQCDPKLLLLSQNHWTKESTVNHGRLYSNRLHIRCMRCTRDCSLSLPLACYSPQRFNIYYPRLETLAII